MATKKKARKASKKATKRTKATAPKKAAKRVASKPVRKAAKKPAAKKQAAKKRAAKKQTARTRPRKAVARKVSQAKPVQKAKKVTARPVTKPRAATASASIRRRDRPGHLDPKYAADLLEKSGKDPDDPNSFVPRPRSQDDLVEELGEEFVEGATTAEHPGEDALNREVPEELGGPFVETSATTEFAHGTDASNPKDASREPFPRS